MAYRWVWLCVSVCVNMFVVEESGTAVEHKVVIEKLSKERDEWRQKAKQLEKTLKKSSENRRHYIAEK